MQIVCIIWVFHVPYLIVNFLKEESELNDPQNSTDMREGIWELGTGEIMWLAEDATLSQSSWHPQWLGLHMLL